MLGHDFFADEDNLNLLSRGSLSQVTRSTEISEFEIGSVALVNLPTNLLLLARKTS
jgi:hypothetical protein